MIHDTLKLSIRLNECIRPADDAFMLLDIYIPWRTHSDRRQWEKGDASAMIPFQIADRFLCRLCIFGDNIAHTPTERCLHCRKEALRNTNEIGDGSRHVIAPRLLGTEDDLYVLAKALIALLHTPKKLQTLLCSEHLALSLSELPLIILLCTAKFFHLFLDAAAFFFHPAQFFFDMAGLILCCCKFRLCLYQK